MLLPEPVGPEIITSPFCKFAIFFKTSGAPNLSSGVISLLMVRRAKLTPFVVLYKLALYLVLVFALKT